VNAAISFTVAGARYSIVVNVWVAGVAEMSQSSVCGTDGVDCRQLGELLGGRLFTRTEDDGERVITTVYHFRYDGTVVSIAAYNYDMTGRTTPVYMPTIPVTTDQLGTLAADPKLVL
jgi:hypothetical protein